MRGLARLGHRGEGTRTRRARARSGFTLVELTVSMTILMIGVVSVVSATSRMHSLRKFNREATIAQNALRSMSERIHAQAYRLSLEEAGWAEDLLEVYGPGGTFGDEFDARGINVVTGEPSVGTIEIFTDETLTDVEIGHQLGMPRDLNGDGDAADGDVSGDARILPVLLTLQWRGETGVRTVRHGFYVMGY